MHIFQYISTIFSVVCLLQSPVPRMFIGHGLKRILLLYFLPFPECQFKKIIIPLSSIIIQAILTLLVLFIAGCCHIFLGRKCNVLRLAAHEYTQNLKFHDCRYHCTFSFLVEFVSTVGLSSSRPWVGFFHKQPTPHPTETKIYYVTTITKKQVCKIITNSFLPGLLILSWMVDNLDWHKSAQSSSIGTSPTWFCKKKVFWLAELVSWCFVFCWCQ